MKARTMLLILAVCIAAVAVAFASEANMGTWRLNEAKSKFPAGVGKNNTVMYEAAGDSIKVTVDGVDGKGSPTQNEWTEKIHGKDYPAT
jgi:hypothetical protein